MSAKLLAALVDTLVPGGALPNGVTAPPASAIEVDWTILESRHPAILASIAAAGGGREAFIAADECARTRLLENLQTAHPEAFTALVATVLVLYYEDPAVLAGFGWSPDPPQPDGHTLPPFDETLLAPVKARGRRWRDPANG
jgi:hypothetical protein